MKLILLSLISLFVFGLEIYAQKPNAVLPDNLKEAGALLTPTYPKIEAKSKPKAPADSVWIFRGNTAAQGTVEVGFQGAEVIYMVFRRGTGGTGWKLDEIARAHDGYHKQLLKEDYNPVFPNFTKYNHSLAPAISAAVITKKGFDPRVLNSAF